ncbi:hypothetical protein G7077_09190 [Sphingomonas piscis]|uniref:Uncharacterized protein n=1 Tax=Sphingomonas piscis TaxID=2714943 RepID=A0A6G7YQM1_9SPHN|nr:hypothetical protein [Sphingomonas piscis]QIK79040.1 hypothetical protein G7077_09190 [Sphingomonas piscis]
MTTPALLELLAGIVIFVAGLWLYRKRGREDGRRGSQTAVLLFAVAAIMIIHATGLLDYRPGAAG